MHVIVSSYPLIIFLVIFVAREIKKQTEMTDTQVQKRKSRELMNGPCEWMSPQKVIE